MTLTETLSRVGECPADRAGRIALRGPKGEVLTYDALAREVVRLEQGLRVSGMRRGDRALYAIRATPHAVALQLAVLRAGGVLCATNLGLGETVFETRVGMLKPKWVLSEPLLLALSRSALARRLLRRRKILLPRLAAIPNTSFVTVGPWVPGAPRAISLARLRAASEAGERLPTREESPMREDSSPSDEAFIVFTSGTTGTPKGVVHTRASVAAMMDLVAAHLDAGPDSVMLSDAIHLVVPALLAGARVIIPAHGAFDPARLLEQLERDEVTHVFGVPQEWQEVVELCHRTGRRLPRSLRVVMLGSAPVRRPFLERLSTVVDPATSVRCVYGMSEALPLAAVTMSEKLAYTGEGDLLGTPYAGVGARVDTEGELHISGPPLFRGYLEQEPVTEHATGDLARIDEQGRLVLLGRRKDMIIRGHFNIYPELYEPRIESIAGVRRCALIGVYDDQRADEQIVLVVEPTGTVDADAFARRVQGELVEGPGRIDAAALPDRILVMPVPVSGRSSKIDRQALRETARKALCASS